VIRPPAGAVVAGQLENRATVLQRVAAEGMRAAWMAFTGEDPELISALRAYPAVSEATAAARGRPDPRIGDSIVERAKP
jgi:hypothetical protein